MHARGANVALSGSSRTACGERRASWRARGRFEADVTDLEALEAAVQGTVERFGAIDVAVANAGIAFTGTLASAPSSRSSARSA